MEKPISSDIVIIAGNSHPELANLIARWVANNGMWNVNMKANPFFNNDILMHYDWVIFLNETFFWLSWIFTDHYYDVYYYEYFIYEYLIYEYIIYEYFIFELFIV